VDAKLIVMKLPAPNPVPFRVMALPTFPCVALSVIDAVPAGDPAPAVVPVLVPVFVLAPVPVPVPGVDAEAFDVTVNVAVAMVPAGVVAVTV
jgi:hypothetical protein